MADVLADFAAEFSRCWLCGTLAIHTWPPHLEIHHIVRGPRRAATVDERCTLVRTCQRCHAARLDGMPVATQLALKRRHDPEHYDRVRVNRLRGRADDAISEAEVVVAHHELESGMTPAGHLFPAWTF